MSGSSDKTVRVWDILTGECLHELIGHDAEIRCVKSNTEYVASADRDVVKIWNATTGECLESLEMIRAGVQSLKVGIVLVSESETP